VGNWIFPSILICLGTLINVRYSRRIPVLSAWVVGFGIQAVLRSWLLGSALIPSLTPMTGIAFLLFTFYMITDPPTSPSSRRAQVAFGLSLAGVYGLLMAFHIVFGLFFSLVIVCAVRGTWVWWHASSRATAAQAAAGSDFVQTPPHAQRAPRQRVN
jgi:Na+-translocating ferredoxin:NAD+ oxidoreductase RnfD subunit